MKFYTLNHASQEIARWRAFFRAPGGRSQPPRDAAGASEFESTEWAITEWSETLPEAAALSGPPDATGEPGR